MKTSTVLSYLGEAAKREYERQRLIERSLGAPNAKLFAEFFGAVWMILTDASIQMEADEQSTEREKRKSKEGTT